MGRIKTKLVKRVTNDLMREHGDDLKDNFDDNKAVVEKYLNVPSKKIRNTVAGYATRLVKQQQKSA